MRNFVTVNVPQQAQGSSMNIRLFIVVLYAASMASMADIKSTMFSYTNLPDIEVFYSTPDTVDENTKILFIMHGASRTAENYLAAWQPFIKGRNVVAIAPKFTKELFPQYVTLMRATTEGELLNDQSLYLDNIIPTMFDVFKAKLDIKSNQYRIYGHSGGSQFVHRFLLLRGDSRIDKAVMANAGFYTFLDPDIPYPFGIKNLNISDEQLEAFLWKKNAILLGDQDTDPRHRSLNRTKQAKKQGKHRFERGTNFFFNLVRLGESKQLPFRWRYEVVKGVEHSNQGMTPVAASFLLEDL
jgi:pimeloyl-ACP methyl ester carboxylesterase